MYPFLSARRICRRPQCASSFARLHAPTAPLRAVLEPGLSTRAIEHAGGIAQPPFYASEITVVTAPRSEVVMVRFVQLFRPERCGCGATGSARVECAAASTYFDALHSARDVHLQERLFVQVEKPDGLVSVAIARPFDRRVRRYRLFACVCRLRIVPKDHSDRIGTCTSDLEGLALARFRLGRCRLRRWRRRSGRRRRSDGSCRRGWLLATARSQQEQTPNDPGEPGGPQHRGQRTMVAITHSL